MACIPTAWSSSTATSGSCSRSSTTSGIADNTIVVFTTDNGAEVMSWPDGGATPFRGEKDTNWEGGWRIPCVMRWPGVIEPGRVINDICSLQDFIPTFAAANGEPDLVEKVKKGYKIGGKTFKVHLDGFNLLPFLSGKEEKSPREGFIYWSDDGDCMAMRDGPVQDRLRRAAQDGPRCLARAVVADAHSEVLRSARRPLRARRGELQVQRLVRRETSSCMYAAPPLLDEVARELQGVSAARQGGELQHRPGGREADAEDWMSRRHHKEKRCGCRLPRLVFKLHPERSMPSAADKRAQFRKLHEDGCFVIPNPWDAGSARLLQGLGFKALASTSSGMAWSLGLADYDVSLDEVVLHLTKLSAATDLPLNADFENGFADEPERVAANVRKALATGVAGLSIEDTTRRPGKPLYETVQATERIKAARAAIDADGTGAVLVGRAEGVLFGHMDVKQTLDRLVAIAEAGADCLYAPGLKTAEDIAAAVKVIAPKPLNVLAGFAPLTAAQYADLGVRRVSVGGALAKAAYGGLLAAARQIAEEGRFDVMLGGVTGREISVLLKR